MTQPIDILNRAMWVIGARATGESLESSVANDCFDMLNDMIDGWANQKLMVFYIQEVIHELTAGKEVYTIGPGGDVGAVFTGTISGTTLTVEAIASGAISVGQSVNFDGRTIVGYLSGRGGNTVDALGTYQLTPGSLNVAHWPLSSYAPRPLRLNSAFVRIVNSTGSLDYPVAVLNVEDWSLIGQKNLSGPWPRAVYYQPTMPVGVLNYWADPASGEMHLFCDTLLSRFSTLNDTIVLPPGYEAAMRWGLAELLMPVFPVASGASGEMRAKVPEFAQQGRAMIKRTNMQPQQTAKFDPMLNAGRAKDAGWILSGGFYA